MTASAYWEPSLHKYQVVITASDVTSACEWLTEQGFNKRVSWRYQPLDYSRVIFEFVDKDTSTLFKLRWL